MINCSNQTSIKIEKEFKKIENKSRYEILIGDTFEIMLEENPSIGFGICWLNEKKVNTVKLIKKEWYKDGAEDCLGCNGTSVFTFRGISKGIDSIKMTKCPMGIEQKKCSSYSEDSVQIDNIFIVKVN